MLRTRSMLTSLLIAFPLLTSAAAAAPSGPAAVVLSNAPAVRAEAVSGVAPMLAQPSDMTLTVGETADQTLHATDADGNPLTFSKASGPTYMTVTTTDPGAGAATGNVHLAPGPLDTGITNAGIRVTDGLFADQASFQIRSLGPNVAPVLTQPADMTVGEGESLPQTLNASDANGDPLSFYLASGPAYVVVTTVDPGAGNSVGQIVVSPGFGSHGTVGVTVGASDGVLSDEKAFSITVTKVNASPVLTQPSDMTVLVDEIKDQALSASDPNGDPVTFSKVSGPSYMTVTTVDAVAGTGNVRLNPRSNDGGAQTVTVLVTDGALSDQKSFVVNVTNGARNEPPFLLQPSAMKVAANEILRQTLVADDVDGDPLEFSLTSGPTYASVSTTSSTPEVAYGALTLTPSLSDVGSTVATVSVSDGIATQERSLGITVVVATPAPKLQWQVLAPFFDPRTSSGVAGAAASLIAGKIYVSHGTRQFASSYMSIYDVATNAWVHGGPSAPDAVFYGNEAAGGTAFGKHYAMGGGGFGGGQVEEFNPATSSWTTRGARLAPPRLFFGAASWEGKIYAIGGVDLSIPQGGLENGVSPRNEVYDPTLDVWTALAPVPAPVAINSATVAYQGKIYVFGGVNRFFSVSSLLHIYDIASNTWSAGAPMATARAEAMAGVIGGRIVVFGGDSGGSNVLSITEIYDPASDSWASGPDMPAPAAQMAQGVTYDETGIYSIGSDHGLPGTTVMVLRRVSALVAAVDLDPNVINLKSHAPWVTAYVEPSGFDPVSIDLSTVRLAGSVTAAPKFAIVGDRNRNGVPDLTVRFSREALDPLLVLGVNSLEVTGSLATGEKFAGTDQVRVISPGGGHNAASVAPNPFNPSGVLAFTTANPGHVGVAMFDLQGRLVRTLMETPHLPAGEHEVTIDGRGERGEALPSGVYFYRVSSPGGIVTGRFAILK